MKSSLWLLFLALHYGCNKQETPLPIVEKIPKAEETVTAAPPIVVEDPLLTCFDTGKKCSEVNTDHPEAQKAFQKGCDSKDFYSCYRLGQYLEHTKNEYAEAIKFYEVACSGKDEYGCESSYDLHMKLCHDKDQKKFCGVKEPQGEYRILEFLEGEDKYQDAFITHDFSYDFQHKKVVELFEKLTKVKDQRLLKALQLARTQGKHDGASAEGLSDSIRNITGKRP